MPVSIRERQRAVTRDAIRDAAIEVASQAGFAAMTMDKVAERAGLSPSTVYRYYADRDALLAAIMDREYEGVRVPAPSNADELADVIERAMADFENDRALNRAIVVARVGQETAWTGREERVRRMGQLLDEVTDHLDPDEARLAKAVIVYLAGGLAWLTMADESGLEGAEAGRAAGWAIRTLIADLRARNEEARPKRRSAAGTRKDRSS